MLLEEISLQQKGKDGKCCVIDITVVITPAVETYCDQAARVPLHTAKLKETEKVRKTPVPTKNKTTPTLSPLYWKAEEYSESERATEVFKKLCNIITQQTGQSASNISYFWKAKLLVLLAKVTHKWAIAQPST